MIRLLYWLLVVPAYYDTSDWLAAMWRKHVIDDCPPHLDTCESCRTVSCDCTKVSCGLPVGRKVRRPTRRDKW
jgi:hypothetical protein